MALKSHQKIVSDDVNFRLDALATRGELCCVSSTAGECEVVATAISGARVAGILLMDVVATGRPANLDTDSDLDTGTSTANRNFNKNETYKGGVVRLARKGELSVSCSTAVSAGDTLYIANSGAISATQATGAQEVGFALEAKDSDGYVKMFLDC